MHPSRWHPLVAALLLAVVSWAVALAYVARYYWTDAGDLRSFALWCLLAAALACPAMRILQLRGTRMGSLLLLSIASLAGLAFGIAYTYLMALIVGGWIGAFGFPVLLCSIVGSVVGFLAVCVALRPRVWLAAGGLAVALPIAAAAVMAWRSQAPPDAIVYFTQGTTDEQIAHVWNEVLGVPTNRGTKPLDGVQSMAAAGDSTRRGIRLSFQPGTSEEPRAAILSRARSVPFVNDIVDAPRPTPEDVRKTIRELREMERPQ